VLHNPRRLSVRRPNLRKLSRRLCRMIGLLLTIVLCFVTLADAKAQKTSFPGTRSETTSPDGRYTIRNADDGSQVPAHTLTLIDNRDGAATKVYSYARHVDVLWAPTSNAFVVNDYEGSDESRPILFTAPWTNQPVDLREEMLEYLRSRHEARSVLGNGHVYFSAKKWLSGNEVLCNVTGYGDVNPKGFTKHYVYKLGHGFQN